jgi:hypothetical protein
MAKSNEPLPTSSKFCYFFELKPAVAFYITFEYILWILLLLSAVNLELECIEKTDLIEFEAVLKKDLYYNIIFGPPDPIPHDNARCENFFLNLDFFKNNLHLFLAATIFLNTVLVMIFLLYFVFTPFLLVGLIRVSLLNFINNFLKHFSFSFAVKSELVYSLSNLRYSYDKSLRLFLHCRIDRLESPNVLDMLHIFRIEA